MVGWLSHDWFSFWCLFLELFCWKHAPYLPLDALLWEHGLVIACRLSVRLSVRPSVCLSLTLVDCDHIGWNSWCRHPMINNYGPQFSITGETQTKGTGNTALYSFISDQLKSGVGLQSMGMISMCRVSHLLYMIWWCHTSVYLTLPSRGNSCQRWGVY